MSPDSPHPFSSHCFFSSFFGEHISGTWRRCGKCLFPPYSDSRTQALSSFYYFQKTQHQQLAAASKASRMSLCTKESIRSSKKGRGESDDQFVGELPLLPPLLVEQQDARELVYALHYAATFRFFFDKALLLLASILSRLVWAGLGCILRTPTCCTVAGA
ncbi:hypothetical protein SORBI_3005G061950 [Sorghum bicolor]|uniref:Uncharacterized protein n=1 Tax=Sorghum bicolor TaxID=4558 RepID=A0A1B6PQG8_SORBI|nr:hypothetical protein SORBI_3005G061950 [Sorghum bicolor]